jgi:hypothetical protein
MIFAHLRLKSNDQILIIYVQIVMRIILNIEKEKLVVFSKCTGVKFTAHANFPNVFCLYLKTIIIISRKLHFPL